MNVTNYKVFGYKGTRQLYEAHIAIIKPDAGTTSNKFRENIIAFVKK